MISVAALQSTDTKAKVMLQTEEPITDITLLHQAMEVTERVIAQLTLDEMQVCFVLGSSEIWGEVQSYW